jgi:cytochrome c oxidase cbb3-type subunit 4
MDINDFRAWFTVIMVILFVSIVVWAWSRKRVKDFEEAANLPLNEPERPRRVSDHPISDHRGGAQ